MKPRKRPFKQDNKLKMAYIKDHKEYGNDFIGTVPIGSVTQCDLYLLFNIFLHRPIGPGKWDKEKKEWVTPPTLIEELEKRGYDISTLYFEIKKKQENDNE